MSGSEPSCGSTCSFRYAPAFSHSARGLPRYSAIRSATAFSQLRAVHSGIHALAGDGFLRADRDFDAVGIQAPRLRADVCHEVVRIPDAEDVLVNGAVGGAARRLEGVDKQVVSGRGECRRVFVDGDAGEVGDCRGARIAGDPELDIFERMRGDVVPDAGAEQLRGRRKALCIALRADKEIRAPLISVIAAAHGNRNRIRVAGALVRDDRAEGISAAPLHALRLNIGIADLLQERFGGRGTARTGRAGKHERHGRQMRVLHLRGLRKIAVAVKIGVGKGAVRSCGSIGDFAGNQRGLLRGADGQPGEHTQSAEGGSCLRGDLMFHIGFLLCWNAPCG